MSQKQKNINNTQKEYEITIQVKCQTKLQAEWINKQITKALDKFSIWYESKILKVKEV